MAIQRRVLVVDDDPMILSVVAEALGDEGFAVDRASNGQQALEQARQARPSLIVLDLMMPVMDGWAFLDAYGREAEEQAVPIVVLSASRRLPEVTSRPGVRACVEKPFDLGELIDVVQQHAA